LKVYLTRHRNDLGVKIDIAGARLDSFADLTALLERHCSGRIDVPMSELLPLHETRNLLYHQGNGVTSTASELETYLDVAGRLLVGLFGNEAIPDAKRALQMNPEMPTLGARHGYPEVVQRLAGLLTTVRSRAAVSPSDRPAVALLQSMDYELIGEARDFINDGLIGFWDGTDDPTDGWIMGVQDEVDAILDFLSAGVVESPDDLFDTLERLLQLAVMTAV
jgi:hypothetical protein